MSKELQIKAFTVLNINVHQLRLSKQSIRLCNQLSDGAMCVLTTLIDGHCLSPGEEAWHSLRKVWNTTLSSAISQREVMVKFWENDRSCREELSMQDFWRILMKMREFPAEFGRVDMYVSIVNCHHKTCVAKIKSTFHCHKSVLSDTIE